MIVDDEEFVREAMELYFITEGFHVFTAASGHEAIAVMDREKIHLAILDILMPGMDGIQLLREIKKRDPEAEVVMASGCGTIESAIESMRLGAYDYVTKPILNFDEDLLKVVRKALERRELLTANRTLTEDLREINVELKRSNTTLKKNVAELEVLYETGRMLAELDGFDSLVDLTMQTLQHQFQIPAAMLLLPSGESWRPYRAIGFQGDAWTQILVPTPALCDQEEPETLSECTAAALLDLEVPDAENPAPWLLPLRALNKCHGMLVLYGGKDLATKHRQLRLLAAQVAAPVALHRIEVAQ